MTINDVYQEISSITQNIISNGISIDEKWPNRQGFKISWSDQSDLSLVLKNIPYDEKYAVLEKERNFNFKMLDGALIQLLYTFNPPGRKILSHRLAFFPSPNLERFDDQPNSYEEEFFGDSEFHDLIEKNIVAFPIRFDFNLDENQFIDVDHPYAHATFGEYKNCRIPITSPISPSAFMHFIIRNFYNYAIKTKGDFCPISNFRFDKTITDSEKKLIHFNIE